MCYAAQHLHTLVRIETLFVDLKLVIPCLLMTQYIQITPSEDWDVFTALCSEYLFGDANTTTGRTVLTCQSGIGTMEMNQY